MNRFRVTLPKRLLALLFAALVATGCGIANVPAFDEQVKAAWSGVLNRYQRRAELNWQE